MQTLNGGGIDGRDGRPKGMAERRDNHMVRVNLGNNQEGRGEGPIWSRISYEKRKKDRVS